MKNNYLVIGILVYLGYILSAKRLNMNLDILKQKFGSLRTSKFEKVYNALKNLPLNDLQFKLVLAQVLYETGFFSSTSNVFDLNNNASGVIYTGSVAQLKNNAIKGSKRMKIEGGYYAKFPTLTDWANEHLRVLNRKTMPLMAIDTNDFATRLKQNNYYTDGIENYRKGVNMYFNIINKLV